MRFLSGREDFSLRPFICETKFSYPERVSTQRLSRMSLLKGGLYLSQTFNQALTFLLGLLRWSETQNP